MYKGRVATERELKALHLRNDLHLTLDQIGKALGCSRERARMLIRHAEWKLSTADVDPTSIDKLSLSVYTRNALYRSGIKTIDALTALTPAEVLKIHNIGPVCLSEIIHCLAEYGYQLKEE